MELTPLFADLAHFLLFILRDWWDITAGALIVMASTTRIAPSFAL